DDTLAEATALYQAMRHQEAETAFGALAERETATPEVRCEARLMQGKAMVRRRARLEAGDHLRAVADACESPDVRAWARYHAGKALGSSGRPEDAIAQYQALEREAPEHRLADDALYHAALLAREAGDAALFVQRLESLVELYPAGDMRGEALFLLAMHAWDAGDLARVSTLLERARAEGLGEEAEDLHGRAAYWHARALAGL